MIEQALDFRSQILEAAQPEIDEFSQRLFDTLQEIDNIDDMVAGAAQIIEGQEECWRLICHHLEAHIQDCIRQSQRVSRVEGSLENRDEHFSLDVDIFTKKLKELIVNLRNEPTRNGGTARYFIEV